MQLYLYINAILYAGFAVWCTLAPQKTAANLGFLSLSAGGNSEYLSVYGGLQLGLACMFYLLGRSVDFQRLGVLIAIGLYLPIVLYRIVSIARNWPVSSVTVSTGCLEATLLLIGIILWTRRAIS